MFRGSDNMHSRSFLSIGSWVGICLGVWVVSWVVAESIPVFNDLLSLIVRFRSIMVLWGILANTVSYRVHYLEVGSAVWLLPSLLRIYMRLNQMLTRSTVGLPAIFWLHMNKGQYFKNWKKISLTIINVGILAIACAIVSILDDNCDFALQFKAN
jgi:hypothetical protein